MSFSPPLRPSSTGKPSVKLNLLNPLNLFTVVYEPAAWAEAQAIGAAAELLRRLEIEAACIDPVVLPTSLDVKTEGFPAVILSLDLLWDGCVGILRIERLD